MSSQDAGVGAGCSCSREGVVANLLVADVLAQLATMVVPGVTTRELDIA